MLVFLDESFRTHHPTEQKFGVLSGVGIPEDIFASFQQDWFEICRPYHGVVLKDGDDVHGKLLLNSTTFRVRRMIAASAHWSLAEDLLLYSRRRGIRVFGVVCFRSEFQSVVCADETKRGLTFSYLFERIDVYMRDKFPRRFAKIVFDDRGHGTNWKNGRAATNFLMRSQIGASYDTILRTPLFGVSKAKNYGLQLADLVTTVIGLRFQGGEHAADVEPLWRTVHGMLHVARVGERDQSSLKVMRSKNEKDSATRGSMAGEIAQHRVSSTIIGSEVAPVNPIPVLPTTVKQIGTEMDVSLPASGTGMRPDNVEERDEGGTEAAT